MQADQYILQTLTHQNLRGSIFLGDGNPGAFNFLVGDPLFGVVWPLWLPRADAGEPAEAFLSIVAGGRPINLDTVHGSSKPETIARAMYRASSRCIVG